MTVFVWFLRSEGTFEAFSQRARSIRYWPDLIPFKSRVFYTGKMATHSDHQGKPRISVRWLKGRRVRITATRGAVTTEATLTEAEANQLAYKLDRLLNGTAGPR